MFREMRRIDRKTTTDRAYQILQESSYGVFTIFGDDGFPYGIPVNHVVVDGDIITLTNAPINGVILNFSTVRFVDENSNSFDIPASITATAGGKEFILNADSLGQFDTKTVKVQYLFIA